MAASRIQLEGLLCTGVQQGAYFTQLDWVTEQCRQQLGFSPYPGTFNLKVEAANHLNWRHIQSEGERLPLTPPTPEFCAAFLYPARLAGMEVAAVVPLVEGYPDDVIEILAPVNLRQALNVRDNDSVKLSFSFAPEKEGNKHDF